MTHSIYKKRMIAVNCRLLHKSSHAVHLFAFGFARGKGLTVELVFSSDFKSLPWSWSLGLLLSKMWTLELQRGWRPLIFKINRFNRFHSYHFLSIFHHFSDFSSSKHPSKSWNTFPSRTPGGSMPWYQQVKGPWRRGWSFQDPGHGSFFSKLHVKHFTENRCFSKIIFLPPIIVTLK